MKKQWTVNTKDTSVTIAEEDGIVRVGSFRLGGTERGLPTELALPEAYGSTGGPAEDRIPFRWTLVREEERDGCVKLLFSDEASCCTYRAEISGRSDLCGPVEFSGLLTNLGPEEIRVTPGETHAMRLLSGTRLSSGPSARRAVWRRA